MFKKFAVIGMMLLLALSFTLNATERTSISWTVEIHSCDPDVNWKMYYIRSDETKIVAFTGTGTDIFNRTLSFGTPVDVLKMGAEAENGMGDYDCVEEYESSHLDAELWLGVGPEPDPGTPGTD